MAFHDVAFPSDIAYGSSGGPTWDNIIVTTDSGTEQRVSRWSSPRHRYTIQLDELPAAEEATLRAFFNARQGATHSFRFTDFGEYSTAPDGRSTPTHNDQVIGIGDGTTTTFQIVKKYASGGFETLRTIELTQAGSVKVGVDGVNQASGWTETYGAVTFASAPANGTVISAGCGFDVKVRFDVPDGSLSFVREYPTTAKTQVNLIEVRNETPIFADYPYRGAKEFAPSSNVTLSLNDGGLQSFEFSTGGYHVTLPNPATIPPGESIVTIINPAGAPVFEVHTHTGTNIATMTAGSALLLGITIDGSGNKFWQGFP